MIGGIVTHGRARVLVVALALVAVFALALAPRADAIVTNVAPFNGASEPIVGDVIQDDAELWAYVTAPTGGVVCVHEASTAVGGSCGGGFAKTPVPPFFAGFVPVSSGNLPPGEYVLMGGTLITGTATAISGEFTVAPCAACGEHTPSKSADYVNQANTVLQALNSTCSLLSTLNVLWRLKPIYEQAVMAFEPPMAVGALVTTAATAAEATYEAYSNSPLGLPGALGSIAGGLCTAVGGITGTKNTGLADWVEAWANDPPDADFASVFPADPIDYALVPGVPPDGFVTRRTELDRLRAYAQSSLHDYERYQGAALAASGLYKHVQAAALGNDLFEFSRGLERAAGHLEDTAAQARTSFPDVGDRTVPQADLDQANTFLDRLRSQGFLAGELSQLQGLGLSSASIARLRTDLTHWDPGSITGPVVVDASLDQLATAMRALATRVEDFARDALVSAGRSNQPPTAAFTSKRKAGSWTTIAFTDNSTSPDLDPLTITWDFGDGQTTTTAKGEVPEHAYAPGTYTVTQTVSDGIATATASAQVGVGSGAPQIVTGAATDVFMTKATVSGSILLNGWPSTIVTTRYEWGTSLAYGQLTAPTPLAGDPATVLAEVLTGLTPDTTYHVRALAIDADGAVVSTGDDVAFTTKAESQPPTPADDALVASPAEALDVLSNDDDPDGDPVTLAGNTQPAHGTASCSTQGACLYTADADYSGSDAFTYTARDPEGKQATATVTVTVGASPAPATPVARDDDAATRAGQAITVHVLANDAGAGLTVTATTTPKHGAVTCSSSGACDYTPAAGYSGADGFTYTAEDAGEAAVTAAVHVLVAPGDAGYGIAIHGAPASGSGAVPPGGRARWDAGAAAHPSGVTDEELRTLAAPAIDASPSGLHATVPGSVVTAKGWTAGVDASGALHGHAGQEALLGSGAARAFPRPLPPISQGTGGDGHVPILVGTKVFAFFHHSIPTSATCVDRSTGTRCPGYPKTVNASTSSYPGPGAVVGSRIWVHLTPSLAGNARTAPISLYCWDAATDRPCGLAIVDRVSIYLGYEASAPVVVGGKVWFAADTGRLYCIEPASGAPCATPSVKLPLPERQTPAAHDIVTHGTRVYTSQAGDGVACVDVAALATCPGWTAAKQVGSPFDLVNEHDASGAATGVCVIDFGPDGTCISDASPGATHPITSWPQFDSYSWTAEAETGKRTLVGSLGKNGAGCFDWVARAPCAGGGYDASGWLTSDANGPLPSAYGTAFDGACVVGLGDPGQVFTVDPAGSSPCLTLGGARRLTVDLRDQRCDATVGRAAWDRVRLLDAEPGELTAALVTVRDAASGAVLTGGDLVAAGGAVDLSGIDPLQHPAITIDATATSAPGDHAWDDAIAPRILVVWTPDPRQLCIESVGATECSAASPTPIALLGRLVAPDIVDGDARLDLLRPTCPATTPTTAEPQQRTATATQRTCTGARLFQIRLRYPGAEARKVVVTVGGKRQKVLRMTPRPVVQVDLRGKPVQTTRVKITITTRAGKRLTGVRVYHPCTKKLPDRGFKY